MATPPDVALSVLEALAAGGMSARRLASRIDLTRSAGIVHGIHRFAQGLGRGEVSPGARVAVYRRIWTAAAATLDAEIVELPGGFLEIRRGPVLTRVYQQAVSLDDAVSTRLSLHKDAVHRLLRSAGLAVPEHLEFDYSDPRAALDFLAGAPAGCVVKAAHGTGGGDGTTCGVTSVAEFRRARLRAGGRGDVLLIERQVAGPVYRLLLLDGVLLDVVCQVPPTVDGDGRSTIEALMRAETRRRVIAGGEAGLAPLRVDLDCILTLARSGLSLDTVPAAATRTAVKTVTNEGRLEDCRTARGELCDEIVDEARRAAAAVGLRLAGVDVITPDPTRPLAETGGVIAEINGMPALHRHYQVADPENAATVAVQILSRTLDQRHGAERNWGSSLAPAGSPLAPAPAR
jgi:cyanophycin synthetase